MKFTENMHFYALLCCIMILANHTNAQNRAKLAAYNGSNRAYLEYLPPSYSPTGDKTPVLIYLHGGAKGITFEDTQDSTEARIIENTPYTTPAKLIKNGEDMCFTVNGVEECLAVFTPITERANWAYINDNNPNANRDDVAPFVKFLLNTYNLDPNRVYLTGHSMGGVGSWVAAYFPTNDPPLYTAIVPVGGRGSRTDACKVAQDSVSAWAITGGNDTANGPVVAKWPILSMLDCDPNADAKFSLLPGVYHNQTPNIAYNSNAVDSMNIYKWFLSKTKNSSGTPPTTPVEDIILDNDVATLLGDWTVSTAGAASKYGSDYLHDGNTAKGTRTATYVTAIASGDYEVSGWWFAYTNRSSATPISIIHDGDTTTIFADQKMNDGEWVSLGTYHFSDTAKIVVSNNSPFGYVVADAFKFSAVNPSLRIATEKSSSVIKDVFVDSEIYPNPAGQFINITGLPKGGSVRIFDLTGQLVLTKELRAAYAQQINISMLKPGIYLLEIENTGKRLKLIVE